MKIAVIGAGIAGLTCAWRLARDHAVTLYEANRYFGGHTNTVEATVDGITYPVDTGFLVFNERTYPGLIGLFAELGVATAPSDMSFSARIALDQGRSLEWAGHNLNSVFAQRRNLLRPDFLRMLADIVRFNKLATHCALNPEAVAGREALADFLRRERFSDAFRDWYLLPMAAAIWSCPTRQMLEFPLATFVRFFHNHGLLQIENRPQWYTVAGGAQRYVEKLLAGIPNARRAEPVQSVRRAAWGGAVSVQSASGTVLYDQVVFACHSDQALRLLADPTAAESAVLGAVRYQPNRAVLHTDADMLPHRPRAWAAWNYESGPSRDDPERRSVCVHYLINQLQPVPFKRPVIVSLNPLNDPAPDAVLAAFDYAHPVFDQAAIDAQGRLPDIQGERNTWFCGAWTGYGFHEDGFQSGSKVAAALAERAAGRLVA